MFEGTVKSFSQESGYGFVTCPGLRTVLPDYDKDVFLHQWQLKAFAVGSAVRFTLKLDREGRPQAYDLEADLQAQAQAPQAQAQAQGTDLGHFAGAVKSYCPDNGYGFVTSAELRALGHERDAFLHKSQVLIKHKRQLFSATTCLLFMLQQLKYMLFIKHI